MYSCLRYSRRLPIHLKPFLSYQTRNMASIIDAARTTLSQNLGGVAQAFAPAGTQFSLDDVPDQSNKVAVVTGGSAGTYNWVGCKYSR